MSYQKSIFLYDDEIGRVDYVQHMGTDLTVVNSARVSFGVEKKSLDKRDEKLIKYLIEHKHTSTLEHNIVTFRVKVPLFVRSQHHRHRTWSYNEISRRYVGDKGVKVQFYEPKSFRTQHKSNRQSSNIDEKINPKYAWDGETYSEALRSFHLKSLSFYQSMLDAGICREQARGVLPQNMYTEYYATTNLNNLIKFIDLRTHDGAQLEIQVLAKAFLEIAKDLWPVAVGNYRPQD